MSTETATEPELGARETERIRNRVRLMVEITARSGSYRKGLAKAADRLTPEEAAIIADLEQHGLDVEQLRDVLCGGHVLVDEPGALSALALSRGQPGADLQPPQDNR